MLDAWCFYAGAYLSNLELVGTGAAKQVVMAAAQQHSSTATQQGTGAMGVCQVHQTCAVWFNGLTVHVAVMCTPYW